MSASSRTLGGARDLAGLAGGGMQCVRGPVPLLFRERGLVDEDVRALGQHAHGFGGRGVAGDHDASTRARLSEHGVGREHPPVRERHRVATLERTTLGA